jgi:hypothetical protein
LWDQPNPFDFAGCNCARYNDPEPARVLGLKEECDGLRRRHSLPHLIVMSNKNFFRVIDAELNSANQAMSAAFQLPEPLKGLLEIGDNRHAKLTAVRRSISRGCKLRCANASTKNSASPALIGYIGQDALRGTYVGASGSASGFGL